MRCNAARCPLARRILYPLSVVVFVTDAGAQDSSTVRVRIKPDSGRISMALAAVLRQGPDSLRLVTRGVADSAGIATVRFVAGDSLVLMVRGLGYEEARLALPARLPPDTTLDVTLAHSRITLSEVVACGGSPAIRLVVPQAQADSTMPIHIVLRDRDRDTVERRDAVGWQAHDHIYLSWRPGVYDVEVSSPGFRTWSGRRIVVKAGPCGPITRELRVHLTRR